MDEMDPQTIAAAEQEVRARLEKDFVRLFNDGFRQHELHAPDGIFMPHLMETVYWHTAKDDKPKPRTELKLTRFDVIDVTVTSPDSAFTVSEMEYHNSAKGETQVVKSLTVWKKRETGWLLYRDMYNMN